METISAPGNAVRLPDPKPGVATAVHRFSQERAFILHPEDFHRLLSLEGLLADVAALRAPELSAAAVRAHLEESTPGAAITDPEQIKALLGA